MGEKDYKKKKKRKEKNKLTFMCHIHNNINFHSSATKRY